jgi:hypothetical protein
VLEGTAAFSGPGGAVPGAAADKAAGPAAVPFVVAVEVPPEPFEGAAGPLPLAAGAGKAALPPLADRWTRRTAEQDSQFGGQTCGVWYTCL